MILMILPRPRQQPLAQNLQKNTPNEQPLRFKNTTVDDENPRYLNGYFQPNFHQIKRRRVCHTAIITEN